MKNMKIMQNQEKSTNEDTNQDIKLTKKYICLICNYIYDEAFGWPEDNIPPGTKWEDVPADWVCPDCGARKEDFKMIEI